MRLVYNLDTIKVWKSGSFTGWLYFELDNEVYFPEEEWDDFINIVLNWWIEGFLSFVNSKSDFFEIDFMDGPYSMKIVKKSNIDIELSCFRNDKEVQDKYYTSIESFLDNLILITKDILNFYYKENYNNEEIEKLNMNYKKMRILKKQNFRSCLD